MNSANTFLKFRLSSLKQIHFTRAGIRLIRVVLSMIAIGVCLILIYVYVWRVFQQDVELLPGINSQNPSVNTSTLQTIIEDQQKRVEASPQSFEAANTVFQN